MAGLHFEQLLKNVGHPTVLLLVSSTRFARFSRTGGTRIRSLSSLILRKKICLISLSLLRRNVLRRRGDLCFFSYSSSSSIIVRFNSTDSTDQRTSAIPYLINTCGLSKEKAISALKKVHFESSKNPDSVITLFRENGFTNAQISKLVGSHPRFLVSSVDKNLKPKFDFFKSQGITGSDFAQVVCKNPVVLSASLEKTISPCFELMRSMVHTDAKLLAMLKRSPGVLTRDPQKNLLPNVALLRAHGVPADNIAKLLVTQPRVLLISISRFSEIVEEVKHMKFDPEQYLFLGAIQGLAQMTKSTFEAKFDVYKRWGLSEDEVQLMFQKFPCSVMISEKNIMSTMSYFVKEMGFNPSLIAKQPAVLVLSLRRRIIPRCSVIQILKSKGLVGNDISLAAFLQQSEEAFLRKYVIKFEKEATELLATYQGKGI